MSTHRTAKRAAEVARTRTEAEGTPPDLSRVDIGTEVYVMRWWRTFGVIRAKAIELRKKSGALRIDLGYPGERQPCPKGGRYQWLRPQDWHTSLVGARQGVITMATSARDACATIVVQLDDVIDRETRALAALRRRQRKRQEAAAADVERQAWAEGEQQQTTGADALADGKQQQTEGGEDVSEE